MIHIRPYDESAGGHWVQVTKDEYGPRARDMDIISSMEVERIRSVFRVVVDSVKDADMTEYFVHEEGQFRVRTFLRETSVFSGVMFKDQHPRKPANLLELRFLPVRPFDAVPSLQVTLWRDVEDYYHVSDELWRHVHTCGLPPARQFGRWGGLDYYRCDGLAGLAALVGEKTSEMKRTIANGVR